MQIKNSTSVTKFIILEMHRREGNKSSSITTIFFNLIVLTQVIIPWWLCLISQSHFTIMDYISMLVILDSYHIRLKLSLSYVVCVKQYKAEIISTMFRHSLTQHFKHPLQQNLRFCMLLILTFEHDIRNKVNAECSMCIVLAKVQREIRIKSQQQECLENHGISKSVLLFFFWAHPKKHFASQTFH